MPLHLEYVFSDSSKGYPDMETMIGRRIKELRRERGWDQEKLAYLSDISGSALVKIETGRTSPTLRTLEKIARAMGVRVVDLLSEAARPRPPLRLKAA